MSRSRPPRHPVRRPAAPVVEPPAWLGLVVVVMAAVIVHGDGLRSFFAADDLEFLSRARGLDPTPWGWARPLPGALRWQLFTAWFGVQPWPHLLLAWLLHALSALLVTCIAELVGLGRRAALAAGVLVAGSSVAYTSTHWASGLGEVMSAAFALAALALHLECRVRPHRALPWLAGACAVAAVGSKESVLLLPLAIYCFDRWVRVPGEGRGAMREVAWLGGAAGLAVVVAWRLAPHVAGDAYALTPSAAHWAVNLCTYGAWLVRLADPLRDASALAHPSLLPWGLAVFAVWVFAAWSERAKASRPVGAGLAWFVLMLAPVVPLTGHTYLYYLVAPLAGFGLAAGALLVRSTARMPSGSAILLMLLLAAYVGNEAYQVSVRQTREVGGIIVDRVARESTLLRNVLDDLRDAHVSPGDSIALVSPYPPRSVNATEGVVRPAGVGFGANAYVPLVSALRGGRTLELFMPGVRVVGMGDGVPPAWEGARVFRFENDGHLSDLGRGSAALDSLASDYVAYERWQDARRTLERMLQLGVDGPEVRWRLGASLSHLGDDRGGFEQARLILERWPESPRAKLLRENATRPNRPAGSGTP